MPPLKVQSLNIPDLHHLHAVIGWIELGNIREAETEWLNLSPAGREHPDSLKAILHIYSHQEHWNAARDVAEALTLLKPDEAASWLSLSYTTRRATGGTVAAAWEILFPVAEKFSTTPNVAYNLACYACQLGKKKDAWYFLEKAFDSARDPAAMKLIALDDPDLEPLWLDIAQI